MEPLCVDLFCGLGGWAEGFLAEGYRVVGFDIERHDYSRVCPMCDGTGICNGIPDCLACNRTGRIGSGGYPGQLVLQDAHTIHGSQCRDAACIVASPPCQEFSYMAMPWKLAKAKAAAIRADETGEALRKLTALFDACFRIQREACEAATMTYGCASCGVYHPATVLDGCIFTPRYIPMVVENVKGAQPWVGPAKAHFGSFYLWGDVAMVGNRVVSSVPVFGRWTRPQKKERKPGALTESFNGHDDPRRGRETTNGSWFAIGSNGKSNLKEADGRKVEGFNFHEHEKTGKPGRSFQPAAVDGLKNPGITSWSDHGKPGYKPQGFNVTNAQRYRESNGVKQHGSGPEWFDNGIASHGSKSNSRKAASAEIAKIPFELASYIARSYNTSTVN